MVSSLSIMNMGIFAVLDFLFPIIVLIYFKKKEKISLKPVIAGMIVFFVFTQILEKLLHLVVIGNNLIPNPIMFTIYGALAAGIFEEVGRFIAFKTALKDKLQFKDGLAYGIGHGGMEAILIGALLNIQNLVYSNLINSGLFDKVIGSKVPASQINQFKQLKELLINAHPVDFIVAFFERIFAFGIQIALTMVVLYAVKHRKNIYLFIAILLHALMDFPAALYQMKIITNIYVIEGFIALYFIAAVIFIIKMKKVFSKEAIVDNEVLTK